MKWLNVIKGLSSTLNWIFSYSQQKNLFGKVGFAIPLSQQKNLFGKVGFAIPLSPFPFIPQKKLHFGKSASLKKSWTQLQSFRFTFHLPAHSREKSGSGQTPFQSTTLKSSPLCILLNKNNQFS